MNFFAAASPASRPSRGFIPLVSFLASLPQRIHFTPPRPSFFDNSSTILFSSASRGVSSSLSFLFESGTSLLRSFPFPSYLLPHSLSTQVSRISTCSVVRNHRDYHDDRPEGHGSSLSSDSDLRQLQHDRSVTLFLSLEPSFHRPFRFASYS